MVSPTPTSFFTDGEQYAEGTVVPNDYTPANVPSQAPSSLYPNGTAYDALANVEDVVAEINGLLAETHTTADASASSATASQVSANASHASEVNSAASAAASNASANAASSSAAASHVSEVNAATSAANAHTSELNSASSATAASTQATNAASSASAAGTHEANAYTNAVSAANSAGSAYTSATNAHTSEVNAAASASNAAATLAGAAPLNNPTFTGTVTSPLVKGALKAPVGDGGYVTNDWTANFQNTPPSSFTFCEDQSANGPAGAWWFNINMRHQNGGGYWGTQQAWGWEDNANEFYTRNWSSSVAGPWVRHLNANNYGSYSTFTGAISGASLSVTGAISGASLSVTGAISGASLSVTGTMSGGDTFASRGANSGVYYFGTNGSHYLYFDGTNYSLVNGNLYATAPTQAPGTNNTSLATTAFVLANAAATPAASDSTAGSSRFASTAELKAQSASVTVTPARMRWHPGVLKVAALINNAGGLGLSYGVASASDTGVGYGDLTYNFALTAAVANAAVVSIFAAATSQTANMALATTGSMRYTCVTANTAALSDPVYYTVLVAGDIA